MNAKRTALRARRVASVTALLILPLLGAGCASSALTTARTQYYQGQFDASATNLAELPGNDTDRVLVLMERGTINQTRANYADSIEDWLRAKALADELDIKSVSRETTSMLVNDNVLAYCGAPYERVLLHAFASQSFMALGLWQDAAVEGRALIRRVENRGDYPDDPYSRYVAGFSLELMRDWDGAAFQYRQASEIESFCTIDPKSGKLGPPPANTNATADGVELASAAETTKGDGELICLVSIGHGPTVRGYSGSNLRWGDRPYAEIYAGDRYLGRSYILSRTDSLHAATQKVLATRKTIKTTTRIALKETAAQLAATQDDALGDLVRLLLFALEVPDDRRWETLPQWLAVARVPCPANLASYRIVLKGNNGTVVEERTVTAPLARRDKTFVSIIRAL